MSFYTTILYLDRVYTTNSVLCPDWMVATVSSFIPQIYILFGFIPQFSIIVPHKDG